MKYCPCSIYIALLQFFLPCLAEGTETRSPEYFCARISHINEVPFKKDLPSRDKIYNGLVRHGLKSAPCLVEAITDGTLMQDPRSVPGPPSTITVGDLAFFLWWRITAARVEDILPSDVVEDYKKNGIFAYFSFIQVPGNRIVLQDLLRIWHTKNKDA